MAHSSRSNRALVFQLNRQQSRINPSTRGFKFDRNLDTEFEEQIIEENAQVKFSMTCDLFKDNLGFKDPKFQFDNSHPEDNAELFNESKNIVEHAQLFPERCQKPLVSNEKMQLTALQIKLYKAEKLLHATRRNMDITRRGMKQQWTDLEEKEEQLKQNFIEFNKFVRENYEKRSRANKKLEDDRALINKREEELDNLLNEINKMTTITAKMDERTRNVKIFKEYLQQVVSLGLEFKNVNDIIHRFIALAHAKNFLLKHQSSYMDILENAQHQMSKLIEEKNFVIMGLNNQIANLQARYENANIKALESEELVTEIKNNAVKQLGEIDTVKNSVWNVYVHMATSKKHPIKIKKDNVEEQMMYINRTLTELSKVNKLIKKRSVKSK